MNLLPSHRRLGKRQTRFEALTFQSTSTCPPYPLAAQQQVPRAFFEKIAGQHPALSELSSFSTFHIGFTACHNDARQAPRMDLAGEPIVSVRNFAVDLPLVDRRGCRCKATTPPQRQLVLALVIGRVPRHSQGFDLGTFLSSL
jgi:hypothetical protein